MVNIGEHWGYFSRRYNGPRTYVSEKQQSNRRESINYSRYAFLAGLCPARLLNAENHRQKLDSLGLNGADEVGFYFRRAISAPSSNLREWVDKQIPAVIKQINDPDYCTFDDPNYEDAIKKIPREFDQVALSQAYVNIIGGACFALGLRFAGTANEKAKKVLTEQVK